MMHWNARSINSVNKQIELIHEINNNDLDIVLLNETWLKEKDSLKIKNFNSHRKDRQINKGGGVAILTHTSIKATKINLPAKFKELEIIGIQVENEDPFQIFSIYNPPNQTLPSEILDYINLNFKKAIIFGDLNASHQAWFCKNNNSAGKSLHECILNNNFNIINNDRSTYIASFNIIDLTFCTSMFIDNIQDFYVGKDIGSDHYPTFTTIKLTNNIEQPDRYFFDWKKFKSLTRNFNDIKLSDLTQKILN